MKPVSVLILDDSVLAREALRLELEQDANIKVVGKASTAYEARDQIVELEPDILIADIHLRGMSGTEFVRKLLPQHYMPVILISSDRSLTEVANLVKAVDFIPKPAKTGHEQMRLFTNALIARIKTIINGDSYSADVALLADSVIAIGASTGGAQAIEAIIKELPSVMPPILVAQHMPPRFTRTFAERLNNVSRLSVKEAEDGDTLIPGQVYVAPGGQHTAVKSAKHRRTLACEPQPAGASLCPSVDKLFASVADAGFHKAAGIILTGMGNDGAAGLKRMRDAGGWTIGQDEATSIVYGMPKIAYETGGVHQQLPLDQIPSALISWHASCAARPSGG